MRGLDGNYINTQGDALARMQVALQSEQNRQQIRTQLEAADSLRKLREQVNETEKKEGSAGPLGVKDDQSGSGVFPQEKDPGESRPGEKGRDELGEVADGGDKKTHIDIRV